MTEETLDSTTQGQERPTFLTVLCILTFIGSGLGILGGLFGLLGSSFLSFIPGMGATAFIPSIIGLIASILCLFGAIKMWGLYKIGFTMYFIGAVIAIIGPIVTAMTFGAAVTTAVSGIQDIDSDISNQTTQAVGALASGFVWMGVVWAVIINGLFIGLYAANRKALTK